MLRSRLFTTASSLDLSGIITDETGTGALVFNTNPTIISPTINTSLVSNGFIQITNATASTSTTTGALTVAGGVGIGGALHTGADAFINGARVGIGPAGTDNTVLGNGAGAALQADGTRNVLIGRGCGDSLTTAYESVAIGMNALSDATTQQGNVAIGYSAALRTNGASAGLNTAIGHSALQNNVTGGGAVAVGTSALKAFVPTGISGNAVAVGGGALQALTTGNNVVAVGRSACASQTTGSSTVAVGNFALLQNLASDTVGVGADVLLLNTLGTANVAVGRSALGAATTALNTGTSSGTITVAGSGGVDGTYTAQTLVYQSGGTFVTAPVATITVSGGAVTQVNITSGGAGFSATSGTVMSVTNANIPAAFRFNGTAFTTAGSNTAVGHQAGLSLTTGSNVTAVGARAADAVTTGGSLVAIGADAFGAAATSANGVAIGTGAARSYTGGTDVVAIGHEALTDSTSGNGNTVVGSLAMYSVTGGGNVAVGYLAGRRAADGTTSNTSCTNSVLIGDSTRVNASGETNQIVVGQAAIGDGSNTTVIGNTSTTQARIRGKTIGHQRSATTNAPIPALQALGESTGTPAVGTGSAIEFAALTAASNTEIGAVIEAVATDVTSASEDFDLVFKTMAGGAAADEKLRLTSTGDLNMKGYTEGVVAIGTVGASHTFSLTNGTVQTATLTASTATTFTMPTAVAGKSFTLFLKQAATTGNGTATFTGVKWNATTPVMTATAGRMDIFSFISDGTNWYGSVIQGFTP